MMHRLWKWISIILAMSFINYAAQAAGPVNLAGPTGNIPVTYPNGGENIVLNYDQGNLGGRSNVQIDAIVNQAVGLWNAVPSSTITIQQGSDLSVDVNATNFSNFLNNFQDGLNPVIYDTDGSITDAIFGVGASNNTLGFAGSAFTASTATYSEGRAVINGAINISDNVLTVVFAHEIGHFFGLDHTQLDSTQGLAQSNFALMYPIAFRTLVSLHEDDVSSVSTLYPETNFDIFFGTVTGSFVQVNDTPIRGANIWAQEVNSGEVYSNVSDFLTEGNGFFQLNIPPGTYVFNAESIQTNFTGGSSVGPHSETLGSPSFQAPHPITPVQYEESVPGTAFEITVTAGCAADITFRLNGSGILNNSNCGGNQAPLAQGSVETTTINTPLSSALIASDADGDTLTYSIVAQPSLGSVVITNPSTGAFTYTPTANTLGQDSFSFITNDGTEDSNIATVTVNITFPNAAPVAQAGSVSTNEDTSVSGSMVANDDDGDALTYSISSQGSLGAVLINNAETGAFTYTPNPDANGTDVFSFLVNDGIANSNVATMTVTINAVNDAPVAQAGSASTVEGNAVSGALLASNVDGDTLIFSITSQGALGTAVVTNPTTGTFTYTPNTGATGTDSFSFQVSDGVLTSSAAVTVTIAAVVNTAPVAQNSTISTPVNIAVDGQMLATDANGDTLTFSIIIPSRNGVVVITDVNTGDFTYTPNANFTGIDRFFFRVSDGTANSNFAFVTVTVTPSTNAIPVAQDGSVTTNENTAVTGTLLASDGDGDPLTFSITSQGNLGSAVITNPATGAFTYTPYQNASGTDSFNFVANDGTANSNTATITVTIIPEPNSAPVAQSGSVSINEDTPTNGNLVASDADGDTLTYSISSQGSLGNAVITNAATGAFTYSPNVNANGTDTFSFIANDGMDNSNIATITVSIAAVNDAPVAQLGIASTTQDTAVSGDLIADDVDGDDLQYAIITQGSLGSVVVTNSATGAFTYTPNPGAVGTDIFSFQVSDDTLIDTNTVMVTIATVNSAPVASNDSLNAIEDTVANGVLVASDSDSDILIYSIVSQGILGDAVITNSATGAFTYSPNLDANGTDTFSFQVNDGTINSNIATVTVFVAAVNDAPTAQNGTVNITAGNSVTGTLVANDIDGDALTFGISVPPSQGSVVVTNPSTGAFTYTANSNATGSDSFSFVANDGTGNSNVATISITINSNVNVAPVAQNSTITTTVNMPVSGNMIATDANGDTLTFSIIIQGRRGTVVIDNVNTGAFTYTPNPGATGIDRFFFRVSDGTTNSNFAFITVTINP